jgi:riboflavin kinase / FMN adenylyltransferase
MADRARGEPGDVGILPPDVTGAVVTVGTFDGVHRGHRHLLDRVATRTRELGLRSVLVTFEPHPLAVINPSRAPALLTTTAEKLEVLATTAIDYVAIVPFTPKLAAYEADEFVEVVLRPRYRMRHLVMGYDHGFGRNRAGDADAVAALGRARGFGVEVVGPLTGDGAEPVGSSVIRQAIATGDLATARTGLGRSYSASGAVVHGEKRGRLLGFPTINVAHPGPEKLLPPPGVYAVVVQTPGGPAGGMMNLGPRPTFGDQTVTLEAHLFDVNADLYGATVRIDFVSRLRETVKFDGVDALVAQLRRDEVAAREVLSSHVVVASANSVDSPALGR